MHEMIVQSPTFLTLLGGGSATSEELALAQARASILVAADGGARTALAHGLTPAAVIGDFDSLDAGTRAALDPGSLHEITEQDSTDFEKALARVRTPLALGVGFTGLRRDHELAAYHALLRFAHQRCILLAASDVITLCPPRLTLDLDEGTRVSLFPLVPVVADGAGLRWPLSGLPLAPGARIGTSNAATGGAVRLGVDAPGLLVILPVDALDALIAGLNAAPDGWPERGD